MSLSHGRILPKTDDTQSLAEDYMLMGLIKVQKADLPAPAILENLSNNILVVGGGITGMTAALESAKAGYKVVLVEKEPQLGGFANKLYKKIPTRNYTNPVIVDTEIDKVIKEVESHPNIKVYKSAKIEKTAGQPGLYRCHNSFRQRDRRRKDRGYCNGYRLGAV